MVKPFWFLILPLALINCKCPPRHISRTHSSYRIVNGKPVAITDAPYQVSILSSNSHLCGGSIICERLILTAAHCFMYISDTRKYVTVSVGSALSNSGEPIPVAATVTHPGFDRKSGANDIALVLLERSIQYDNRSSPIELETKTPSNDSLALVTGWGNINEHGESTEHLMGVYLTFLDLASCKQVHQEIWPGVVCAYADDKDACTGDSGGPLVVNNKQAGIVSRGHGCAIKGSPGFYTDVAFYYDWIESEAESLMKKTNQE